MSSLSDGNKNKWWGTSFLIYARIFQYGFIQASFQTPHFKFYGMLFQSPY